MKKYFLHNGKDQHGPFSIDELKQQGLNANSMVWFDGISDWTKAQFIPELKEFVITSPPPFNKISSMDQTFEKVKKVLDKDYINTIEENIPNNTGKKIFKYSLIILAVFGLAFIINMLSSTNERREINNAEEFIEFHEIQLDEYGGTWMLEGKLTNNATKVIYKDIKIEVEFFNKSGTFIGKTIVTVDENFPPNDLESEYEDKTYFNKTIDKSDVPMNFSDSKTRFKFISADVF